MPRYKLTIEYDGGPFCRLAVAGQRLLRSRARWRPRSRRSAARPFACMAPGAPMPACMRWGRWRIATYQSISCRAGFATVSTHICGRIRSACSRRTSCRTISKRGFPPGGAITAIASATAWRQSRDRHRPCLAAAAAARHRCDACGRAAASRQTRFHDLSRHRMPGQVAGKNPRPVRRDQEWRRGRHRDLGAFVPAQPGALDGGLAGLGRRRPLERG